MSEPRSDRVVVLGSGTCQLEARRAASAVLVEVGGVRLVFDFGRGIATRLVELGLRQDDVEHVVLSHFHPDHLSDLVPYLHAGAWSRIDPRTRDLHVHGPRGLEVQLRRLLGLFGPDELEREHYRVVPHEVRGEELEVGGRRFVFADLPPAGNHGLRWTDGSGRTWCLTGDSSFHDPEVAFLRGADVAVVDSGHLADDELLELAVRTGVPRLVCSHLYRELDADELTARARERGFRGRFEIAADLTAL